MIVNFRQINSTILQKSPVKVFRSSIFVATATTQMNATVADCHIDLRGDNERNKLPLPALLCTSAIHHFHLPLSDETSGFKHILLPNHEDYLKYYRHILSTHGKTLKNIFELFAHPEYYSYWLSCHFGKDRTGIVCILLMLLLKESPEEIASEYGKSAPSLVANLHCFNQHWEKRGITAEQYQQRLELNHDFAAKVISLIEQDFGGVQKFLLNAGVSHSTLGNLKIKFEGGSSA